MLFICEVNGTEISFELKLSKYSRTFRGLILVMAHFYRIKKKKNCSLWGPVFANFLSTCFHWPRNFRFQKFLNFVKTCFKQLLCKDIFSPKFFGRACSWELTKFANFATTRPYKNYSFYLMIAIEKGIEKTTYFLFI